MRAGLSLPLRAASPTLMLPRARWPLLQRRACDFCGATAAGGGGNNSAFGYGNGGNSLSKPYGVTIIDILDYTNTNKYTTSKAVSVSENNDTTGYVIYNSLLWSNTAAVTTIRITSYYAWTAYSSFALYGIK